LKLIRVFSVVLLAVLASGCATKEAYDLGTFHSTQPKSILVVPPINRSTDVQATTSVLATLPYYLGEKGYYVFPVNTVKTLLEHEGYYEPAEIHAAPPEQLAGLFHADAILYVTVHEWTSKYVLLATTTEVDLGYKLVAADGTVLWKERQEATYSPNSNSGGGLAGLVVNAIAAAAERASPNYLPLTRRAHAMAIISPVERLKHTDALAYALSKKPEAQTEEGIPPGPDHPAHEAYYKNIESGEADESESGDDSAQAGRKSG
jgi:hypothetical protein